MAEDVMITDDPDALKLEIKKLKRELKRSVRDNEMLRMANEQSMKTQEFIQRDNRRQIFFTDQLLKSSPYVLVLTDEKLMTVMISDKFFEYSDLDPDRVRGGIPIREVFEDQFAGDELEEFLEKCDTAIQGIEIEPYIMSTRLSNGESKDLHVSIRQMKNDFGEVLGLDIIFVDMTDMIEAREKADQANKAKSSFLANMSHEIRTPINAVLGMDEMILRESREKNTLSYAEDIKAAGKTLLALVNEILDFSKVEEGRMEIFPIRYELGSLINDVVNMVQERMKKKGLKLILDIDEEIPHELTGDEIRIKQCVLNLMNNAVKYTEKGSVKLGIGYRKKDDESIYLEIHVKDTGIGMKQEDMERLFEPFQRIEEKRNRNIEGTGLGMSITKKILELMGSSLFVDSVYGKGTDFSFSLVQRVKMWDPIGEFSSELKKINRSENKKRYKALFYAPFADVLVVDDTNANLTVMKGLLKKTGIRMDMVLSGREAIEKALDKKYDIIFIDHMMPEMDGIETLVEIKKLERASQTIFIALTANAISGARQMYLDAGFDDYISKPVDGETLEKMIMKYLPPERLLDPDESFSGKKSPETDEQTEDAEPEKKVPDWLYEITGLDVEQGIGYCDSEDAYMKVIETFHETADQKCREITGFYITEDWKNYTIRVHALKSSARLIGAVRLSKLAESLEEAGNNGDIEYIKAHTDACVGMYEMLDNKLKKLDEVSDDLPLIEPSQMKEAYAAINDFSINMDFKTVESVLGSLKGYKLPTNDQVIIGQVHDKLMMLDWDAIEALVKPML